MTRVTRLLPIVGGAVAGGAIALAVAGGGTTHSTTTVIQPASGSSIPTSLSGGLGSSKGQTINQIFRQDGPGVVDITVTAQTRTPGFVFFGGGTQETEGEG